MFTAMSKSAFFERKIWTFFRKCEEKTGELCEKCCEENVRSEEKMWKLCIKWSWKRLEKCEEIYPT